MSVELQKLRAELLREALLKGWTRPGDVQSPWTQQIPAARLERWYKRLYQVPRGPLPVGPRLLNRFMLGADPEFVFHDGMKRVDARTIQLKAGPAFGADNNGRLCELRPAPSRSALSVLASLWLAMRWMVVYHPSVLNFNWRAGSYFEGDGLGGHIHFGRKRAKFRDRELSALDRVTHLQFVSGIFDRSEGRLRVVQAQGAPAGQPYGALSDARTQPHGYEYRTLPSWIDNIWLAYFNLVLSKLIVGFPELSPALSESDANITSEQARNQLRMLLAYYTPLDDDARLAHTILAKRGFPAHAHGTDFKGNWGIFPSGPLGHTKEADPVPVMPETVPPRPEDEAELQLAMLEGRPPELTALTPSWTPNTLPTGYVQLISYVDTKLAPGLGEIAMQLCVHSDRVCRFINTGHGFYAFRFPMQYAKEVQESGLLRKIGVPACADIEDSEHFHVNASKDFSLDRMLFACKQIVESGVFPIWDIKTVQPDSLAKWLERGEKPKRGSRVEFKANL